MLEAERTVGVDASLGSGNGGRRRWTIGALLALLLAGLLAGLLRDGTSTDLSLRLASPSLAHPLGADAVGHDHWGRLAEGTLLTVSLAAAITAAALLIGALLGTAAGLRTSSACW